MGRQQHPLAPFSRQPTARRLCDAHATSDAANISSCHFRHCLHARRPITSACITLFLRDAFHCRAQWHRFPRLSTQRRGAWHGRQRRLRARCQRPDGCAGILSHSATVVMACVCRSNVAAMLPRATCADMQLLATALAAYWPVEGCVIAQNLHLQLISSSNASSLAAAPVAGRGALPRCRSNQHFSRNT